MRQLTVISFVLVICGSVYFTNVGSVKTSNHPQQGKTVEDASVEHLVSAFHLVKNLFTTCTACQTVSGMVQDPEAVQHAKDTFHGYCDDMASKFTQFCHSVVDKAVDSGLEFLKQVTVVEKCEQFCGEREEKIDEKFACNTVRGFYHNIEFFISLLKSKVASVCETETDPEQCLAGFIGWKSMIIGFFQRSTLRVGREIDAVNYCGINLETVPKGEKVLQYPKIFGGNRDDSTSCVLCEYLVESACEMVTGPNNRADNLELICFVYSACLQLLYKTTDNSCPPPDTPPSENAANCVNLAGTFDSILFPVITNYTNYKLWPTICHSIDKSCTVNPSVPMCNNGPPVPNGGGK